VWPSWSALGSTEKFCMVRTAEVHHERLT
jgi:hypothetical protein